MPTMDEFLEQKTFKGQGLGTAERVYYTLHDNEATRVHRTMKLLSLVVARMVERGELSESELDELLMNTV